MSHVPIRKPPTNDEQLELFSAMFTDIIARETQDTMEVPFLSLSKSPRFTPIHYNANGVEVTVSGGEPHGIANIFDWDLIIWLLSQIRQAKDQGQPVSRKIRFSRWAYLKDARRQTGGDEYRRLESAIARLKHTTDCAHRRSPRSTGELHSECAAECTKRKSPNAFDLCVRPLRFPLAGPIKAMKDRVGR